MGAAKNRKAEIEALKAQKYVLAIVTDPVTTKYRVMSMPMVAPFLEMPEGISDLEVIETMLNEFIEGRKAADVMTKYHFVNWVFNYIRAGGTKLQADLNVVDRKVYDEFNAEMRK